MKGCFEQISSFLKTSNADIIGLQEVQADDPKMDVVAYLSGLGYQSVFTPIKKTHGGKTWNDGPAIFSKYPIINKASYILSQTNGRAAVRADVQIHNAVIRIFSTHLMHTHQQYSNLQQEQAINLINKIPNKRALLMGDFNATPDSAVIQRMRDALIDTDPKSAPTWSQYPDGCDGCDPQGLNIRLDYIFVTKDIKTSEFKVGASRGSDHLPISVMVEV